MSGPDGSGLRSAVVIPVRGHGALLDGALASLRSQTLPPHEVIVVDDSPDGSMAPVGGVRLLRSHGGGPYRARNIGWGATDADVVLFMDARSRPAPTWTRQMLNAFTDPAVGLVGSDTRVLAGSSWAARTAAHQQIFAMERYTAGAWALPYFPTCNLAVRRHLLETVGGFTVRRSGADADLCWRLQTQAGQGVLAVGLTETLMEWVPRDRLVQYVEQFFRYGRSSHALGRDWALALAPPAPAPWSRLTQDCARLLVRLMGDVRRGRGDDAVIHRLEVATDMAYAVGTRVAHDGVTLARWRQRLRVGGS